MLEYRKEIESLASRKFDRSYEIKAAKILKIISRANAEFPYVTIIHRINLNSKQVLISFGDYVETKNDESFNTFDFIYASTREERKFIHSVLEQKKELPAYFQVEDDFYKLIYPVKVDGYIFFLLLTDYQQFGKVG
ncbi:hypothetical protein CH373_16210 [Leptospira perolatii]|uniref:Uncharacterized protein n=1 Tax=Leptospira perolatii TaxID=2023191 RepID=A0A2M9ZJA8_9LEPT|nr:hypothetical protein CH360_16410 [Leptospira perolatii]PJZ72138.1 hypothetical protein CH373_16210 [Leptospira perolatii]